MNSKCQFPSVFGRRLAEDRCNLALQIGPVAPLYGLLGEPSLLLFYTGRNGRAQSGSHGGLHKVTFIKIRRTSLDVVARGPTCLKPYRTGRISRTRQTVHSPASGWAGEIVCLRSKEDGHGYS